MIATDVLHYNTQQTAVDQSICSLLAAYISKMLPEAENKLWHTHPVWFIDNNPVVGYSKLKDSVRLLFWSGQSFEEPMLGTEGKFMAAEIRYTDPEQIVEDDLNRWLDKAKHIQWDYKNIVKRKGVLERLK